MEPDDARLAIERHATSKIRRADDLAAIATLGFRGEALPAIASVSHFVLRTRARGMNAGTEIKVNGGAVASITEAGMPASASSRIASSRFCGVEARGSMVRASMRSSVVTESATLARPRAAMRASMSMSRVTSAGEPRNCTAASPGASGAGGSASDGTIRSLPVQ